MFFVVITFVASFFLNLVRRTATYFARICCELTILSLNIHRVPNYHANDIFSDFPK